MCASSPPSASHGPPPGKARTRTSSMTRRKPSCAAKPSIFSGRTWPIAKTRLAAFRSDKDALWIATAGINVAKWQTDPALAGVRDEKELAQLTVEEQKSWRQFWTDASQLAKKTRAAFTETIHKGTLSAKKREEKHEWKLQAGQVIIIDMESPDFDTFLRLEDDKGKELDHNDDISNENLNSRLVFIAPKDGVYRIVATSFEQRGQGAYTLTIRQLKRTLTLPKQADGKGAAYHDNLASVLMNNGDLKGAIEHLQEALDLDPDYWQAHYNFATVLLERKKDLTGAIHHFREALRINPDFAEGNCNFGHALQKNGEFTEALKYLQCGHELGIKQPGWSYASPDWVQDCKRLVKLDREVPDVLRGDIKPASLKEWKPYVDVCRDKKSYANAFYLWKKVYLQYPVLAFNHPKWATRLSAAIDAVMATGNQDHDASTITDADRMAMRKQAYEWLCADLGSWNKCLQKKQPDDTLALANVLAQWEKNPGLADVRDKKNLTKLSDAERESWQKLWAEVEQLRKQADGMFKETTRLPGELTVKQPQAVHEATLQVGTIYVIDLVSDAFDTVLRLENAQGKKLVENDDVVPRFNLNSQLMFAPPADGVYRLVATTLDPAGGGNYTLTIREFVYDPKSPQGRVIAQLKKLAKIGEPQETKGRLTKADSLLMGKHSKTYSRQLKAGKHYLVDLMSTEFDTYLIVKNAAGKVLAEDDDGGEGTNSRLLFVPQADGEYTIVVQAFKVGATGSYTLRIQEFQPADREKQPND